MFKNILKNWLTDSKFLVISSLYICIVTTALLFAGFNTESNVINNNTTNIDRLIYINGERLDLDNLDIPVIKYNKNDLREKSNLTEKELSQILKGTNMEELVPYLISAEKEYGVNAMVLTGMIANNSNWNTSERAVKYNNVFNLGVFENNSKGLTFKSKEEAINYTAKLLANEYLNEDGMYFNGYSLKNVSENFCNSNVWVNNVNNIIYNLLCNLY